MTGKELYEFGSYMCGYKCDPWEKLPTILKEYYEQIASPRRGNDNIEQGESVHAGEQTCCGGCSGHC